MGAQNKRNPCSYYHRLIHKAQDGTLSSKLELKLDLHLQACASCERERRLSDGVVNLIRGAADILEPIAKRYIEKLVKLGEQERQVYQNLVTNIGGFVRDAGFNYYFRKYDDQKKGRSIRVLAVTDTAGKSCVLEYSIAYTSNINHTSITGPRFWIEKQPATAPPASLKEKAETLDARIRNYLLKEH